MALAPFGHLAVSRFDPSGNEPLSGPVMTGWGTGCPVGRYYLTGYTTNDYPGPATVGDAGLFGGSSRIWTSDGSDSCRRPAGLPLETRQ